MGIRWLTCWTDLGYTKAWLNDASTEIRIVYVCRFVVPAVWCPDLLIYMYPFRHVLKFLLHAVQDQIFCSCRAILPSLDSIIVHVTVDHPRQSLEYCFFVSQFIWHLSIRNVMVYLLYKSQLKGHWRCLCLSWFTSPPVSFITIDISLHISLIKTYITFRYKKYRRMWTTLTPVLDMCSID